MEGDGAELAGNSMTVCSPCRLATRCKQLVLLTKEDWVVWCQALNHSIREEVERGPEENRGEKSTSVSGGLGKCGLEEGQRYGKAFWKS